MRRLALFLALVLTAGVVAGGCEPAPPKDNSNIQEPPAPPPPGAPGQK